MTFSTAGVSIGARLFTGGGAVLRVIERAGDLSGMGTEGFEQAAYLSREFFRVRGALCCLWMVDGIYVSLLRLEPWRDGLLLTGLETLPEKRNCGYAGDLLTAVQAYLKAQGAVRLYSHIDKRNGVSIHVHEKCGFCKIADTATLLDGTITARMGTYLWNMNK